MRAFFKSKRFKILLGILAGLIALIILTQTVSFITAPVSGVVSAITQPISNGARWMRDGTSNFFATSRTVRDLEAQKLELEAEIGRLNQELADATRNEQELEWLQGFLNLPSEIPNIEMVDAFVVANDPRDALFRSFTINRGSIHGITERAPVITHEGVVGYIHSVTPRTATVMTILNPNISIAALARSSEEMGNATGHVTFAQNNHFVLEGLERGSAVRVGEQIVTSGLGENFPDNLVLGTALELRSSATDMSEYVVVDPAVNFDRISRVMVIIYF